MATPIRVLLGFRRRFSTEAALASLKSDKSSSVISLKHEEEDEEGEEKDDALYRRLSALGKTPDESAEKVMNKWLREGKRVYKTKIEGYIKALRKYKRYKHALQLSEWMETRGINMSHSDHAIRIDLLSKTEGLASAEKYFTSLTESAKNWLSYGALLNCYCRKDTSEKAITLFEKMRELNFASTTLAYNNLMTLYMRLGQPEQVPSLIQEMKSKHIMPDTFTYNVWMNSCATMKDIEGAERVVEEIKKEERDRSDWSTYSNLAAIYVQAGLHEKAELALKELEKKNNLRDRHVFHCLIGLYAGTGNLPEVYRIWESLKSAFSKTTNLSYLVMLQALVKLDDVPGAENLFGEWESGCSDYDIRLVNVLISAYLRRDMIGEAEILRENSVEKGFKLNFRTLEMFMDCYLKVQKMDLALRDMEIAVSNVRQGEWKPNQAKVQAFLKYFEQQKDVNGAEEFIKNLKKVHCVDREAFYSLLQTYIAAGKTQPLMRQRMEEEKIHIDYETEKLLAMVCG